MARRARADNKPRAFHYPGPISGIANGPIKVSYMTLRDVPFVVRRHVDLLLVASNLMCP